MKRLVTVTLESICKRYSPVTVIDNLNLTINDKEFVVLLGPSGCGKTTTLRCIAGLEAIDSGNIKIDDKVVNDVPPQKRDIAMVFQNYALYPFMSVKDNLAFPLKLRGMNKDEIGRKVKETSEFLRISKLLDRKPRQLSGGEQQRVALGRALIRGPKLFLLDEPLSNLDAKLRIETRTEIKRIQRELGITTIFVTHDQAEAMALADRIAVMGSGVLQQVDSPSHVYTKPANIMVAQFLGSPSMNIMKCSYVSSNKLQIKFDGISFEWSRTEARALSDYPDKSNLLVGFRPEDASFVPDGVSGKESIGIPAEVYISEPAGTYSVITLKSGDNLVKVFSTMEAEEKIGDKGYINVKDGRLSIFDGSSGKRIV